MKETETAAQPRREPLYRDPNLQIIFGITLIGVMGVASITPAFPKVVRELGISAHSVGLLISVFTLPGVVLTPIMGVLADRFGRKKIIVPSLMLFAIAGTACWFARDFRHLLVLRFFQGAAAASLGSLNLTLIGDLYSGRDRVAAMGYNASVLSIGTASYPAIGGLLAVVGWNYPFLLPPVAIPVGLLVLFSLKSNEPKGDQRLKDYFGNVWQHVKRRSALVFFTASLLTFIILYGTYFTYLPLLLGTTFGASSLIIGLLMSVMSLTTAFMSSQLGRLASRYSERNLLRVSFVFYAAGLVLISFTPKLWLLPVPVIIFGIGHGVNVPTIHSALAGMAPRDYRGAFLAINGMVLRLGQTLGPLLMAAVFAIWGVEGVFYAGAACALGMSALVTLTIP